MRIYVGAVSLCVVRDCMKSLKKYVLMFAFGLG